MTQQTETPQQIDFPKTKEEFFTDQLIKIEANAAKQAEENQFIEDLKKLNYVSPNQLLVNVLHIVHDISLKQHKMTKRYPKP